MAKQEKPQTPESRLAQIAQPAKDGDRIVVDGQVFVVRVLEPAIPAQGADRLRTGPVRMTDFHE